MDEQAARPDVPATGRAADEPPTVGVVGAGLIGGSILRRCVRTGTPAVAFDRDPSTARDVGAHGVEVASGLDDLVERVDVVVLAVPPRGVVDTWSEVLRSADGRHRPGRLVAIDVSSVKRPVTSGLERAGMGTDEAVFLLTHPMAGRASGGWPAARDDLFDGAAWIVCAHPQLTGEEIERVAVLVETAGAQVGFMAAGEHDRFAAHVSHLPHLLAFAYLRLLDEADPAGAWTRLGAGSLADLLRVSGADPELWEEILDENAGDLADAREGLVAAMRDPAITTLDGRRPQLERQRDAPETRTLTLPWSHPIGPERVTELDATGAAGLAVTDRWTADGELVLSFGPRARRDR